MKIKVISLNIWNGGKLFPAVLDFLKAESADIVMLQEVYDGDNELADNYKSMSVLRQKLDYEHAGFARAYLEKKSSRLIPHGNAILSKFPILSGTSFLLAENQRQFYLDIPEHWPQLPALVQSARLKAGDQFINVFNVHGPWNLNGDDATPRRRKLSQAILERTSGLSNVIVGGDTNAKSSNPAMLAIEDQLKSVFGQELKSTFNMRRKTNPGYGTAAVDLMFVSPGMKITSKRCPDVDISDHLPIVVEIEVDP